MSDAARRQTLGDVPDAFMNLVRAQMDLGRELFESVTGMEVPSFQDQLRKMKNPVASTCRIPPPCWMPQPLGDCTSHVSACKTACIRLVVTNCDRVPRTITVRVTGDTDLVTITPASVVIGPMDCETIEVCRSIPGETATGTKHKTIVWVEGCKLQFLRWTVSVGTAGLDSCHEVEIEDCPDYIHHWYDHFYCRRPCFHGRNQGVVGRVSNG